MKTRASNQQPVYDLPNDWQLNELGSFERRQGAVTFKLREVGHVWWELAIVTQTTSKNQFTWAVLTFKGPNRERFDPDATYLDHVIRLADQIASFTLERIVEEERQDPDTKLPSSVTTGK